MSEQDVPNTSAVEGTVIDDPREEIRALQRELEIAGHESEFWYSFARELVGGIVHSSGTATARAYVEGVCTLARDDFPTNELTSDVVGRLFREPSRLSKMYAAWGSFAERREGLARGEPEREAR